MDWLKIILSYIILPLFYFHVNALGQVGEGSVGVARPYGLAEHVEYPVPGLAVASFLYIADDGGTAFDRHLDFEGDLLAPVNESLPYGEGVSGIDFTWHVADFRGHGREPMSGAFAGRLVVERSVGFYTIEFYFVFNFGPLDSEDARNFIAVQVERYGRIVVAYRECRFERDFLDRDFSDAAGT